MLDKSVNLKLQSPLVVIHLKFLGSIGIVYLSGNNNARFLLRKLFFMDKNEN